MRGREGRERGIRWGLVAADFAAFGVLHAASGYLVHRMPEWLFEGDRWLWRERRAEAGGGLYARLGVRRWKGRLPEAGDWFPGGFSKARLARRDPAYLARFVTETRRAELGHWLAVAAAPAVMAWNPPAARAVMAAYAVAANGPCIATQRFNRIRLARVLAPASSQVGGAAAAASAGRKMDSR